MTTVFNSQEGDSLDYTPVAAVAAGDLIHLPDGRCGYAPEAIAAGIQGAVQVKGIAEIAKTTGVVLLDGMEVWFDKSAGTITYWHGNDEDYIAGTLVGDAASGDTSCWVALNERAKPIIDLTKDPFASIIVLTAGTPYLRAQGGAAQAGFSATAEAQKIDLLSQRSFPIGSDWILEAVVNIINDADADVADLNIGVANATHASDADSILESCFVHQDMGADGNIDAESDDNVGGEVAATDTTIDRTVGTPFHIMMDGRDPSDIQIYINGALVLGGSTFTLSGATGPLKALFHLEKSANDSPGEVRLDKLTVRCMDL